jgi:predicted membrane GTPase involved in stress response
VTGKVRGPIREKRKKATRTEVRDDERLMDCNDHERKRAVTLPTMLKNGVPG